MPEYATDRLLLRATAGLPLEGPLDIDFLIAAIQQCCKWRLMDCPSCQATADVIAMERAS